MIHKNLPLDNLTPLLYETLNYWRMHGGEEMNCSWAIFNLDQSPHPVLPYTMFYDVKPDTIQR